MPAHKKAEFCKTGDGKPHYARGYCHAHYMAERRGGAPTPDSADAVPSEDGAVVGGGPMPQQSLDQMLTQTSSRFPSFLLATEPEENDSAGIARMRQKLAGKAYLARREVVKIMLFDGYESWQIKNEFLVRKDLFKRFVVPLRDPDRTLDEDINAINTEGKLYPLARYIDGLKRSLRRANAFADNSDLSAKERSSWAKSADDLQRNLAIQEKAIHVVPGHGDMPVGYKPELGSGDDDDDDEYDLPDVEGEEDEDDSDSEHRS